MALIRTRSVSCKSTRHDFARRFVYFSFNGRVMLLEDKISMVATVEISFLILATDPFFAALL
jgi:hypothetical protein